MTTIKRGTAATLSAEWRDYAGGPMSTVTLVTVKISPIAGGAAIVGPTSTGVLYPAAGVNTYNWTPSGALALGQYLVEWSATDADSEVVSATEIITITDALVAPLGGPYATLSMLKSRMGIPDSNTARDTDLLQRLVSASSDINSWTHRQFGRTDVASARTFYVGATGLDVHDFWTTDDLDIVPYLNNVAGTAWDTSSLVLEPANGIVNQTPGWPYNRVATGGAFSHPIFSSNVWRGYAVQVTAKWGWEAVPEPVVTSTLMLAVADDKAKDAPFGVAGFGDFAVRIRANPMVEQKLKDYVLNADVLVAT